MTGLERRCDNGARIGYKLSMAAREFHILLVEDDPADARLTTEVFKETRSGARLSHVADGTEAMNFLRRAGSFATAERPDLILLDLNLPQKDGREVLAEIKADSALRRIPVVVLTTSQAEADVDRVYDLKANCYVQKPIQLDAFRSVVRCIEQYWIGTAHVPAE